MEFSAELGESMCFLFENLSRKCDEYKIT